MWSVINLLCAILLFSLGNPTWLIAHQSPRQEITGGTRIVDYSPDYIPAEKLEGGLCWTRSIAAPRNEKAWRCQGPKSTASGSITYGFDPCFALDNLSVICSVDPEEVGTGLELKLHEPLPKEDLPAVSMDNPGFWRIRLANGSVCTPHTGTMGMTNEKRFLLYSCDDGTGIYEDGLHESGGKYEAENVTYGPTDNPKDGDYVVQKIEKVLISTAWR